MRLAGKVGLLLGGKESRQPRIAQSCFFSPSTHHLSYFQSAPSGILERVQKHTQNKKRWRRVPQQNSARNETSAPVASYLGKRSSLTPTLTGRRRVGSEGTPSLTPSERAAVPPQGFPRSPERAAATVDGEERAG